MGRKCNENIAGAVLHHRADAHISLSHGPTYRTIESLMDVALSYVKSLNVI